MNSKFLKKVVLSCLVLGAVNYGNIGNTMEDNPDNGNAIEQELNIIGNNEIIANENNYIRFENNHYIGEVNGKQIDINASEFKLKEFKESELDNDADFTRGANKLVKMLQNNLNHVIEGRLNTAYKVYEIYTANKKLMNSEIGDIIKECLKSKAAESDYKFDEETLVRSAETIATKYSKSIKVVEENKYSSNKENEKIFKFYYDIMQQISDDFKIARLYDENNSGAHSFVRNFILEENVVKEDKKHLDDNGNIKDLDDFLFKIGILDDGEELEYKDASTLMKLMLKYAPQRAYDIVAKDFGGKYTINDNQVIEFKQKFEDLKEWAVFIIEKEKLIELFNECKDVADEVNRLKSESAKLEKRKRKNEKTQAFLQNNKEWNGIKIDDQSMYVNVTERVSNQFKNLALQQIDDNMKNDNMEQEVKKKDDKKSVKGKKYNRKKNLNKAIGDIDNNIKAEGEQNNTTKEEKQENEIKEEKQQKPNKYGNQMGKNDDINIDDINIDDEALNKTLNILKNNLKNK